HLLVQVAAYDSGFVELGVWNHVVSQWDQSVLLEHLRKLPEIEFKSGWDSHAAAQLLMRNGRVLAIHAPSTTLAERNATLRAVVQIYQQSAVLHRRVMTDTLKLWQLYPDAVALVLSPEYSPEEIMLSAREKAYLPPGVSRHIIQGR